VVGFRYSTVRQSRHRFCIPSVAALFVEAGNFYDLIWKNCQLVAAMALGMLRESTPQQLTCKPESRHPNSFRMAAFSLPRPLQVREIAARAVLPDIPYVGITLTMPMEFRTILQQNCHILHGIPAMGAEAVQQWAKARYGVRLIVIVVQQTFGGLLNFVPHLHVMVSAGGLRESTGRWIHRLEYDRRELMLAWRYAIGVFLSQAYRKGALKSSLSSGEFQTMLETQHGRDWNVFISRMGSKAYRLKHDGRYIRRPPVAQHRLARIGIDRVEYLAKDTRNKQRVLMQYTNEEFVDILAQHVPNPNRHAMRYFGLLSPRCKALVWAAVFVLLNQQRRPHPPRLPWRWLHIKTFGTDPLLDSQGQLMQWAGRRAPVEAG
jgi:hypothetical protein